jgi:ABC-2 type transport system ATP-binding protein
MDRPSGRVLEVKDARRRFGTRQALDGASLGLDRAEIYALLGLNGAGKTSLLRAIAGRLRLDGGSVRIDGGDPFCSHGARRQLGVVPQSIALYPYLTARENLEVLGRLAGVSNAGIDEAVQTALGWTGLEARAHDVTATLSGGMQRRLNIAAGVLHRPAVLLLDEPSVGVDPKARQEIHALLKDLRNAGLAILLTTHDLAQADELADRVGFMVDGRITHEGTPQDLVREAFGDATELHIVLGDVPHEEGEQLLLRMGLRPAANSKAWVGPLAGGLADVPAFGERLANSGLAVAELLVREPGLEGVFFHMTGQEFHR